MGNINLMTTSATTQATFDHAASSQLLDSVCEHAFESVLVTKANSGSQGYPIIYVNQAFTEMTGFSAEEVVGKSPAILQGPKTDASVLERLASNLSAGDTFHGQAINYRKDGSEFMLEWKVAPVVDTKSGTTYLVSVQREVS